MNEHIRELVKQCTTQLIDYDVGVKYDQVDHIKLAELLVQECATYLNVAVEVHNQNEQDVCDRAARAIKRYFGVNE